MNQLKRFNFWINAVLNIASLSKNHSGVFREYEIGTLARNGLIGHWKYTEFCYCLKSIAPYCEFLCPHYQHDLQSLHIKDQLIQFLFNETFLTNIFGKASHLVSHVEIIKHCEAFETAQRNHNHLLQLPAVQTFQSSTYQQ